MIIMPNGYLSYAVAIVAVLGGVAAHYLGWIDSTTMMLFITNGLSLFGIRKSIANSSNEKIGGASHW